MTARRWPEYAMEGALLGLFMVAACGFATLLEHPASPVHRALPDATFRRYLMGVAMGLTAICLIYSPWGQQSGAHMNPSLMLTFLWLGKIERTDAVDYVAGQFLGGAAGVLLVRAAIGMAVAHPAVRFAVTAPGPGGTAVAFAAEVAISFLLMTVVPGGVQPSRASVLHAAPLRCARRHLHRPRSADLGHEHEPGPLVRIGAGSPRMDVPLDILHGPPLGMLAAAEAYVRLHGLHRVLCAKLNHATTRRCIFRCAFMGGESLPIRHYRIPGATSPRAPGSRGIWRASLLGAVVFGCHMLEPVARATPL